MDNNKDPLLDLATFALSIIAIAAFVATLGCFGNSALAEEFRRSGDYRHQICANSSHGLRCRGYQRELHDGLTVGRQRRTSLRRSPRINECWQARGGRHELWRSGNGRGNDLGFARRRGVGERGPDTLRDGIRVDERPSMHVSDAIAAGRLFHAPRWREAR
jgi:hypothetical protein